MKIFKKILKWFLYILALPIIYLIISLILTEITIDRRDTFSISNKFIFLYSNGVHLEIILPKKDIHPKLLEGLIHLENENYLSFGWGDENFYINTPTWNDLTFSNAFHALFLKSSTLMHVTRYKHKQNDWVKIPVNENELKKLNEYISNTFKKDKNGNKIILKNIAYTRTDNFYKAEGSYSCFKTSNTWVNSGFINSGLKSCFWTPFDFGLIKKYK
ncbi:MAG: DUF2459 domain-containing protein [Bacteroidales bacterium]|nr:DUF2459 domain-containing protein [Bacteroidales bacterium]